MSETDSQILSKITLNRLGNDKKAGVAICSLPIPDGFPTELSFAGEDTLFTSAQPLGCWPGSSTPRRLLMTADLENDAPESLKVTAAGSAKAEKSRPEISMDLFETCPDPRFMWERHVAKITYQGKSFGLVMGMRTAGEIHWWEACRLQILSQDDFCTTVEIGGAIPHVIYDSTPDNTIPYYKHPYRHKHNWLYGRVFARLYANGVCEVYAHHVNNRFFDHGRDLEDCVPVIGFKTYDAPIKEDLLGTWEGDRDSLQIGNASLDVTEAARLATKRQPGEFLLDENYGFLTWQPYTGAELYGGKQPFTLYGDGYINHAEDKVFPMGFARTVRFSFSLSDRSPMIARYLPPAWWYGTCKEFMHDDLLPVCNEHDEILEAARRYAREFIIQGGFEDGGNARDNVLIEDGSGRTDPSWEGEMPHAMLMDAWRTGNEQDYLNGLRAAYAYTDIYVDHATDTVRMHGWAPPAISLPMMRVNGIIAGYLETGDRPLREDAQCLIYNAFRQHRNSWPRLATGRDAMFIRGAVMLYRYFNDESFLKLAREAITDVILTQRPDGSFGDQGGGSGTHQRAGYIIKPWMGCMAVGGLIDYLEVMPDDQETLACVMKFGDFLLRERYYHAGHPDPQDKNAPANTNYSAGMGWSYQHYFRETTQYFFGNKLTELKSPYQDMWHLEYFARLLTFCSIRSGNSAYYEAWAESAKAYYQVHKVMTVDHAAIQALQFVPWMQAKLADARLQNGQLQTAPYNFGDKMPKESFIMTPEGNKPL